MGFTSTTLPLICVTHSCFTAPVILWLLALNFPNKRDRKKQTGVHATMRTAEVCLCCVVES